MCFIAGNQQSSISHRFKFLIDITHVQFSLDHLGAEIETNFTDDDGLGECYGEMNGKAAKLLQQASCIVKTQ